MEIFSTQYVLFEILNYKVSGIEFIGTVAGLLSVWFAAKNNIFTWPTGIVNVICFFFIFKSTGLFSDMFLQIYFLVVALYGWYFWNQSNENQQSNITILPIKSRLILVVVIIFLSLGLGSLMSKVHLLFPTIFDQEAAYPFSDTLVAVSSVIANTLMARKKVESWVIWIVVDVLATFIYYQKGIVLVSIEFFIFTILAVFGLMNWAKLMKNEPKKNVLSS